VQLLDVICNKLKLILLYLDVIVMDMPHNAFITKQTYRIPITYVNVTVKQILMEIRYV